MVHTRSRTTALISNAVIHYGFGKHIWIAPDGAVTVFLKALFFSELAFTGVIVFVKYSILGLYWRLFKQRRYMKVAIYCIFALVTC